MFRDGRLNLDIITSNHDSEQNSRFWIEGAAPNSYAGGTDLKIHVGTVGYGRWLFSDVDMIIAHKNGAFGTADVAFSDPFGNLRVTDGGATDDRLSDTAALRLMSGNIVSGRADGSYAHTHAILDAGVNETVNELYLNGFRAPAGTWGAVASAATYKSDMWFKGSGVLTVSAGGAAPSARATAAAGDWDAGTTWGGTVPSYFDDVRGGHAVTTAVDAAACTLAFDTGGALTVSAGQRLDVQEFVTTTGGTLDTDRLSANGGMTVGAGATVIVGHELAVEGSVDFTPAAVVRLPGVFAGDTIRIDEGASLALVPDVLKPRTLTVNGTLDTQGNVLMNDGGRLTGEGTVVLRSGRKLEALNIETPGLWTIGTVGLYHEQYPDGSGHGYLTGISGGVKITARSTMLIVR